MRSIAGEAMPVAQAGPARRCGFSLIELMAILTIVAIMLAIGVPSFHAMLQNQKLTATANALFMSVNLARSEAIHRGTRVDLVPAGDGSTWRSGWVIFIDENHDQRPDHNETILYMHAAVDTDMRITPRFTDSKVQYIAFNGSGRTRTNANSQTSQSGNWLLELGSQSRKVVINFLGRPRVCNPAREAASC